MRYALQPLLDAAGMTLNQLRAVCPMSGRTYRLAREDGLLADQADRWAVAVGLHPFEVWPEMAGDEIRSIERSCEECAGPFVPKRRDSRYCSFTCRRRPIERDRKRRKRAANPEAERARVAAYQSDPQVQHVRRVKARARYAARKETAA